jgi:hypothetical protein
MNVPSIHHLIVRNMDFSNFLHDQFLHVYFIFLFFVIIKLFFFLSSISHLFLIFLLTSPFYLSTDTSPEDRQDKFQFNYWWYIKTTKWLNEELNLHWPGSSVSRSLSTITVKRTHTHHSYRLPNQDSEDNCPRRALGYDLLHHPIGELLPLASLLFQDQSPPLIGQSSRLHCCDWPAAEHCSAMMEHCLGSEWWLLSWSAEHERSPLTLT